MFEHITNTFNDNLETTQRCFEALAPTIAQASAMIADRLIQGNKLLVCGDGHSSFIGNHLTTMLLNRLQDERPGLPALSLNHDMNTVLSLSEHGSFNKMFELPIRTLGNDGDILFLSSLSKKNKTLFPAITAAHDRNMQIIAITHTDTQDIATLLLENDCEIRIPALSKARILEVQLLAIHCITDLIDHQLFGEMS